NNIGDYAYLLVAPIGLDFWVINYHAAAPTPSVPGWIDVDLEKVLPFSVANTELHLDQNGPVATASNLGPNHKNCQLQLGMSYGDLLSDCVQVSGDAQTDTDATNELLGGLQHGTERFLFDISGVDINFTDKTLADNNVVRDNDRPSLDDVATDFDIDQFT